MEKTVLFKAAIVLHLFSAVYSVVGTFPALIGGPETPGPTQGIPQIILLLASFLGVAGIISAYGAWQGQKWGIWLTIVVRAVDGLLALPGVLFAPTTELRLSAVAGIVISLFVIAGMLLGTAPSAARR